MSVCACLRAEREVSLKWGKLLYIYGCVHACFEVFRVYIHMSMCVCMCVCVHVHLCIDDSAGQKCGVQVATVGQSV